MLGKVGGGRGGASGLRVTKKSWDKGLKGIIGRE